MKFLSIILMTVLIESTLLIKSEKNDVENSKLSISYQNDDGENSLDLSNIVRSPTPLYIDIAAIVTRESMNLFRCENISVELYFKDVFAGVSKIFAWHNIIFSLSRIEYWDGPEDPKRPDKFGKAFAEYFTDNNFAFDTIVIFGGGNYKKAGYAFFRGLCQKLSDAIVRTRSFLHDSTRMSNVVAHLIGRNMGLDVTRYWIRCRCGARERKHCLMISVDQEWHHDFPKTIEACQMRRLLNELRFFPCLLKPLEMERLYPTCGDGVVDKGEDCDCGFKQLCNNITMENKCCNRLTCKFLKNTHQCSSGQCCENCLFANKTICRTSKNQCDLPEYCGGSSKDCPTDKFKNDYTVCSNNKGFCKNGKCSNLNHLCQHAYNDTEAYFSNECLLKAKQVSKGCKIPYSKLEELLCDKPNFWKNFMCALPKNDLSKNRGFVLGKNICIFPLEDLGQDLREFATNYGQSWFLQKKENAKIDSENLPK